MTTPEIKIPGPDWFTWMMAILFATLAILIAGSAFVKADDHVIRPTCWEENKGDHVERHCEVIRPNSPNTPNKHAQGPASPPAAAPVPAPRAAELAPPPAAPHPSLYDCATYARFGGLTGCPMPPPPNRWYVERTLQEQGIPYYAYVPPPPIYYAPPPIAVFRFGPFSVWLP